MTNKEKQELKKEYEGPGELMGLGQLTFDYLKDINLKAEHIRTPLGLPRGTDYEVTLTMLVEHQPHKAGVLKVASGKIESLNYNREYGVSLYFIPELNKFTIEFYEEKEK